jgi:hypothetical protein
MHRRALEVREKVLNPEHPDTLIRYRVYMALPTYTRAGNNMTMRLSSIKGPTQDIRRGLAPITLLLLYVQRTIFPCLRTWCEIKGIGSFSWNFILPHALRTYGFRVTHNVHLILRVRQFTCQLVYRDLPDPIGLFITYNRLYRLPYKGVGIALLLYSRFSKLHSF